jgi:hypothetical protein
MSKATRPHAQGSQGFEALRDLGGTFKDSVNHGFGKDAWDDTWRQILGVDVSSKSSGENHAQPDFTVTDPVSGKQDVFDVKTHQAQKSSEAKRPEKAPQRIEAAIDHHTDFVRNSERASKQEMREVNHRLQEIMVELQKLVNSSKVLQMEFAGVTVDQAPEQAGEYHLNFFDWLLLTIRKARENVENSGAWLATSKKKGGKKGGGYWDMFKKHGTTFGLSNERTVATQTG